MKGKKENLWRSLEEKSGSPDFTEFLQAEFPAIASELSDSVSRRSFLKLMGASASLAGLAACRMPREEIVPYVKAPEEVIPGNPRYFATTLPIAGAAYGVVVESHDGRPLKIEGNRFHPASLGGASGRTLASILDLYDPQRSKVVIEKGKKRTWNDFSQAWRGWIEEFGKSRGKGLAFLSEALASPSVVRMANRIRKRFPRADWVNYEPISSEQVSEGLRAITGTDLQPIYRFDRTDVVLSIDSDFLNSETNSIRYAKDFSHKRRVRSTSAKMNRLYVLESYHSLTGGMADHRLPVPSSEMVHALAALWQMLKTLGLSLPSLPRPLAKLSTETCDRKWLAALGRDLISNRGKALVVAGEKQPPVVHAMVHLINHHLRSVGKTVVYRRIDSTYHSSLEQFQKLVAKMDEGRISTLIVLGGNPVFNAPSDFKFRQALSKVQQTVHFTTAPNETSQACAWQLPKSHFLESWGDAQAVDGTISLVQPLIRPLFDSRDEIEMFGLLATDQQRPGHDWLVESWQKHPRLRTHFGQWKKILHDGILKNSAGPWVKPKFQQQGLVRLTRSPWKPMTTPSAKALELVLTASDSLYDGRYANNSWLAETPDPVTKLTWDNAAVISPQTAKALSVKNEDWIELKAGKETLKVPVWILPGHALNSITLALGYGRKNAGKVGTGIGFNAYHLRHSSEMYVIPRVKVEKRSGSYPLACTQNHGSMEGRPIVRWANLDKFKNDPHFARDAVKHPPLKSLFKEHTYTKGNQWGMAIDLSACIGCTACSIACQSENNIPVVGKDQVRYGREMNWMRIDRYFAGEENSPQMLTQPVNCQHCENAPCEQVCPVNATVHDEEGLNAMVYNRCIGTRYCSNNCPYKVRRFNFFSYTNDTPEIAKMVLNPDVTVRTRGVMEKCTYCLQRINQGKIEAKRGARPLGDGEIETACQQACPTDAIVFGDINDVRSQVSRWKKRQHNYELLAELNIRPRTSYLARIKNRNPEIES